MTSSADLLMTRPFTSVNTRIGAEAADGRRLHCQHMGPNGMVIKRSWKPAGSLRSFPSVVAVFLKSEEVFFHVFSLLFAGFFCFSYSTTSRIGSTACCFTTSIKPQSVMAYAGIAARR